MSVVLASRRRWSFEKTGVLLPAELSSSYEFMVVDGRLPATNVADTDVFGGRGDEAALDALSRCGYVAWKSRLVRLYDGRDAEGVMLSVFAPRLLGRRHDAPGERYLDVRWVRWPLSEALGHDPGLGRVLDRAFEELLVERLSEGAPEPCQLLSEAAVRFVELSLSSRDDPAADASMLPVYRRAMSESEIMAADVLVATRDQELGVDETVADKEEDAAGESAGGEIEDEPGEDVDDRGEPEEGFAR
jgi:hypothetical protein